MHFIPIMAEPNFPILSYHKYLPISYYQSNPFLHKCPNDSSLSSSRSSRHDVYTRIYVYNLTTDRHACIWTTREVCYQSNPLFPTFSNSSSTSSRRSRHDRYIHVYTTWPQIDMYMDHTRSVLYESDPRCPNSSSSRRSRHDRYIHVYNLTTQRHVYEPHAKCVISPILVAQTAAAVEGQGMIGIHVYNLTTDRRVYGPHAKKTRRIFSCRPATLALIPNSDGNQRRRICALEMTLKHGQISQFDSSGHQIVRLLSSCSMIAGT